MDTCVNFDTAPLAHNEVYDLDLAFALDCTGSMGPYIKVVQQKIGRIVDDITTSQTCDIRLALVEYRDHPPQDKTFVTKSHDFVASVKSFKSNVDTCEALGGGDLPEAVPDALRDIIDLSWRLKSVKICILVTDAPPHGLIRNDSFRQGCPDGLDTMRVTQEMAKKAISLYVIGCEPNITPYRVFYEGLTHVTSGVYIPLRRAFYLPDIITCAALEEISLGQWVHHVSQEVNAMAQASGGHLDEDEVAARIEAKLKERGVKTTQLWRNSCTLGGVSLEAKHLATCSDMKAVQMAYNESSDNDCNDRWRKPSRSRSRSRSQLRSRSGCRSRKKKRHSRSRSRSKSRRRLSRCSRSRSRFQGSTHRLSSRSRSRTGDVDVNEEWTTGKSEITTDQVNRLVRRCMLQNQT